MVRVRFRVRVWVRVGIEDRIRVRFASWLR